MVQPRTEKVKYFAPGSQTLVAGVRHGDTLRSVRGTAGILHKRQAIAFDGAVLTEAERAGVTVLEVAIIGGATYRCKLETMYRRGRFDHCSRQWQLGLKHWTTGELPQDHEQQQHPQLQLFEVTI